jgi:hypothetical protein
MLLLLERGTNAPLPARLDAAPRRLGWRVVVASLVGLSVLSLLVTRITGRGISATNASLATPSTVALSDQARFVGDWTSSEVVSGEKRTTTFHLDSSDTYSIMVDFTETGRIVDDDSGMSNVEPDGGQRRQFSFSETSPGQFSIFAFPTLNQLLFSADQIRCGQNAPYIWKEVAPANGAAPDSRSFALDRSVCNQAWNTRLDIAPDGRYNSRATTADKGRFVSKDSGWKMISTALGLTEGRYEFVDDVTVTMTWPEMLGVPVRKEVWKRATK